MSERVANKLKQLTLAKRTTRERMQSLIESRMPSEGFTVDDFRELYSKHSSLIIALYQEFMQLADTEATSKGKLLSTIEAGNIVFVLKDLMMYNAAKIAHTTAASPAAAATNADELAAAGGWEMPFFLKELPCFLHQETHIIVRRQGVDALATLISLRAAAAPATSSMDEHSSNDGVAASLVPLMHLLLSSLDWEFLRTTYGSVTTLPNIIVSDVRKGRHDSLPPRARYSTTSGNGADERQRETIAMLKRLLVDTLTEKPDSPLATPQALQLWTNYFHNHVAPLFAPNIAVAAGLVHGASLHGFLAGVHPVVHGVLVDVVSQLTSPQRDDLVRGGRLLQTIGATSSGVKFLLGILAEAVRNPSAETVSFNLRALTLLSSCLRQLAAAGAAESSVSFSTSPFVALPDVRQHVYWWLASVLEGPSGGGEANTIHVAPTLLSLQVQSCAEGQQPTSAGGFLGPSPLVVVGSLQALVEGYAEWLMLVSSSGATTAVSSSLNATQANASFFVPLLTREVAVARLCMLASELSIEAASKPSPHLDEVIPYTVQALWVSAAPTTPLHGAVFLEKIFVLLCDIERRLKLVSPSGSPSGGPQAAYIVRAWMAVVHHHVRVFIAPPQGKLVAFTWPSTANTQSISGTAAASSPLLEYRLKRCPVVVEGVTRAAAHLQSASLATSPGGVSPFVVTFESFHNAMANLEHDTYSTQQAKTSATVDALKILIENSRNWSGMQPVVAVQGGAAGVVAVPPTEPDSLLKIFAPYLLLQSRLTEMTSTAAAPKTNAGTASQAAKSSTSCSASTTSSGGSAHHRMSAVAKDALEILCEIVSLATPERWTAVPPPTARDHPEADNSLYMDDDDDAAGLQPITPVIAAVVFDRLREVLHSIRSGELLRTDALCGDVPGRLIAALFRNATTELLLGKPSSHLFCATTAVMPYGLLDELEASALWVLGRLAPSQQHETPAQQGGGDVFIAALTCLTWTLTIDRRAEAPLALRAPELSSALRVAFCSTATATTKQQKQFWLHLVKTTTLTVSMLLRASFVPTSASTAGSASAGLGSTDRARLQESVVECVDLLVAQYNTLDKVIVPHLHGALHFIIEILEDALKPSTASEAPQVPQEARRHLSREFFLLLYRRLLTALCGVAMYHAYNWTRTQNTGDGLVQLLYLIGELATRVGHVHLSSYHPDDEHRYGVSLAQLISDVVAMTQAGTSQCKYSLGFPGSTLLQRRHVVSVSRVQSAYQLMQDALEAQSRGAAVTAASTDVYTQIMVPPLDASARQWFGANTPTPTDVQADTLYPQQVVQAGLELFSALSCHTASFPLMVSDPSSGTSIPITDSTNAVELSMAAEHTAHILIGSNSASSAPSTQPRRPQVLTVHTEALQGDVVQLQVASAVESSGWTFQPAPQSIRPNASSSQAAGSKPVGANETPAVVTRLTGRLCPTLEPFLDDFRSTRMPPAELLQATANGVPSGNWADDSDDNQRSAEMIAAGLTLLSVPRKSNAASLVGFRRASPPTTDTAPLPRSDINHAFSLLHSIGAVDGMEPLVQRLSVSKYGNNINDGDNGSTVVTLSKPGVHWDAVLPSDTYAPLPPRSLVAAVAAAQQSPGGGDAPTGFLGAQPASSQHLVQDTTPNDDAVAALHAVPTRTLVPPLPCMIRVSSSSSAHAVQKLQEQVYRAFGVVSDDGASSRACTSRHELVLMDAPSVEHAFARSDAMLFFAGNFSDVLSVTREMRQRLAGRSFVALCIVPNHVVQDGVTLHIARQGEGAPLFSPVVDGACLAVETVGLLLRAALLSSTLPWKQPLTVAEAKRRVSQRPTRTFLLEGLAAKDVNQLLLTTATNAKLRGAQGRAAGSPRAASTGATTTGGGSSPNPNAPTNGASGGNASFAGGNNSIASVARFHSGGTAEGPSTVASTAWTLQLASVGW